MDHRMTLVLDRLADSYHFLPLPVLVRVVTDVAAQNPGATPDQLEQAATAALTDEARSFRPGHT